MSAAHQQPCPNWRVLLAERTARGEDPAEWPVARQHLESCPGCRREALALEPTLLFQRLPAASVAPEDIADMKQGVAAMIRASRLAPSGPTSRLGVAAASRWRPLARLGWRSAAAATLVAGLLAVPGSHRRQAPAASDLASAAAATAEIAVVDLDLQPGARVYQLGGEEMQVVMIVDPNLHL